MSAKTTRVKRSSKMQDSAVLKQILIHCIVVNFARISVYLLWNKGHTRLRFRSPLSVSFPLHSERTLSIPDEISSVKLQRPRYSKPFRRRRRSVRSPKPSVGFHFKRWPSIWHTAAASPFHHHSMPQAFSVPSTQVVSRADG